MKHLCSKHESRSQNPEYQSTTVKKQDCEGATTDTKIRETWQVSLRRLSLLLEKDCLSLTTVVVHTHVCVLTFMHPHTNSRTGESETSSSLRPLASQPSQHGKIQPVSCWVKNCPLTSTQSPTHGTHHVYMNTHVKIHLSLRFFVDIKSFYQKTCVLGFLLGLFVDIHPYFAHGNNCFFPLMSRHFITV